jgi:hypothetical protein
VPADDVRDDPGPHAGRHPPDVRRRPLPPARRLPRRRAPRSGRGRPGDHEHAVGPRPPRPRWDAGRPRSSPRSWPGMDLDEAESLVLTLTRWFQLINLVEDNERIRRVRARRSARRPRPRRGSLRDAGPAPRRPRRLRGRGDAAARPGRGAARAHRPPHGGAPADHHREARARLRRPARPRRAPGPLPRSARRRLAPTIQELWASDELRAVHPTVLDEVRASLVWFVTTLAREVPEVYRDLEVALAEAFPGEVVPVPALLSFGSWIGGDRDGNPNVTPEVTVEALEVMREQCLRFLEERVEMLAGGSRSPSGSRGRPRGWTACWPRASGASPSSPRGCGRSTPTSPTGAPSPSSAHAWAPPAAASPRATRGPPSSWPTCATPSGRSWRAAGS